MASVLQISNFRSPARRLLESILSSFKVVKRLLELGFITKHKGAVRSDRLVKGLAGHKQHSRVGLQSLDLDRLDCRDPVQLGYLDRLQGGFVHNPALSLKADGDAVPVGRYFMLMGDVFLSKCKVKQVSWCTSDDGSCYA